MKTATTTGMLLAASLLAGPALAEENSAELQKDLDEAKSAAETMVAHIYVRDPVTLWTPDDVVQKLRDLGYTSIEEFDVDWAHYEVEATTPSGDEVEVDVDPITGAILDIRENWM